MMTMTIRGEKNLLTARSWEMAYPTVFGVLAFCSIFLFGPKMFSPSHITLNQIGNAYTAIGGMFAVITGFLATFYGSIQSIIDTRLKRISRTAVFRRFLSSIKIATMSGLVISAMSVPYIIFVPLSTNSLIHRILVAFWCGACVYGFSTFFRVPD